MTLTAPTNAEAARRRRVPCLVLRSESRREHDERQNIYTFASDYGDWTNHWQGVDATVNARLRDGSCSRPARAPAAP